jgi:hypothetical protein
MKSTTKAIFSLGLISFLTLGGICQNAFAAEAQPGSHHHSITKKAKHKAKKAPAKKTPAKKTPAKKAPATAPGATAPNPGATAPAPKK